MKDEKQVNKKPNNKRRSRNNGKRGKEIEVNVADASVNRADLKGFDNDYTWYTKYQALFQNVTGVNFGNQVGSQINWNPAAPSPMDTVYPATAAGIMAIHYVPTLGAANQTLASPLNKVGAQLFAVMRQSLGSTASYDATDIVIYLGAMDSAYQLYAMGAKIYGILRMASPFNNYFLEAMATANCIDFESFSNNLSNFRSVLNQYAIFLTSRLVPAEFDIFKRHVWLIQNMFTDSSAAKAQMYTFVPDGYYTYVEATSGPGYLQFQEFPYASKTGSVTNQTLSFSDWQSAINSVYESLMGSSDIDQMSADIGKAFDGNTFALTSIPEEYVTPIGYSAEVLSQIENAILCGYVNNASTGTYKPWDIFQTTDLPRAPRLVQNPRTNMGVVSPTTDTLSNLQIYTGFRKMLNFHMDNPSKEDIIVATRGIPGDMYTISGQTDNDMLGIGNYGTEIYTYAKMFWFTQNDALSGVNYTYLTGVASGQAVANICHAWAQFDWAPAFFIGYESAMNRIYRMQDIDMYAMVDDLQLTDMNRTAVLSEFYSSKFPTIG